MDEAVLQSAFHFKCTMPVRLTIFKKELWLEQGCYFKDHSVIGFRVDQIHFRKIALKFMTREKKEPKFSNELLRSTKGFSEIFHPSLLRPLRKCPARTKSALMVISTQQLNYGINLQLTWIVLKQVILKIRYKCSSLKGGWLVTSDTTSQGKSMKTEKMS